MERSAGLLTRRFEAPRARAAPDHRAPAPFPTRSTSTLPISPRPRSAPIGVRRGPAGGRFARAVFRRPPRVVQIVPVRT